MNKFNPVPPSLVRRLADFMELYNAAKRSVQKLDQERFELLVDTVDLMDRHIFGTLFVAGIPDAVLEHADRLVQQRLVERERLAALRQARAERNQREREAALALISAA